MTCKANRWATCVSTCFVLLILGGTHSAQAQTKEFNVPAQSATTGIPEFARQAGIQILVSETLVRGKRTAAVTGALPVEKALLILLAGTGLTANSKDGATFTLSAMPTPATSFNPVAPSPSVSDDTENQRLPRKETPPLSADERVGLSEIIVTGTHIRGATDSASPVVTYSRDEIDRTGLGTVGAFMQSLPQNFNGGASENTIGAITGGGQANNLVGATGINLHGLGNDATMVLVDGHRIAPGGTDGDVVDISMIPLSAVQRIEVVSDGASAIYGSDAVGGVVNIVLRKDFDGAETRARFGSVADGGSHESQLGQTAGKVWDTGSALLNYEFYDRTPLSAAARSYSQTASLPFTLLPEQVRQTVLATIRQSLSSDIAVFADGMYSHRSTYNYVSTAGLSEYTPATVSAYGGTVGGRIRFSEATEFESSVGYSVSDTRARGQSQLDGTVNADEKAISSVLSVDGVLNGSLWSLPSGAILYAVGGQYRNESFDYTDLLQNVGFHPSRDIVAGFAELRIPLLGPSGAKSNENQLELSIADRDEHYSDFGSTNNPKIGLMWRPISDLKIRSTYGTSFVAPSLSALNPIPSEVVAYNTSVLPGSGPASGDINTLIVFGGNPNLTAQTAKTWTFGADWEPITMPGFRASATYYGTDFKNRIATLEGAGFNPFFVFSEASILGSQIIQFNPPTSLVQTLIASPGLVNYGADLSTGVGALIHDESLNLSVVHTSGIDFDVSYRPQLSIVDAEVGVASTYILNFNTRFTATSPTVEELDTQYNPTRLKMRARMIVAHGSFTSAAYLNYVSSYSNTNTTPYTSVASWTTFDLTGTYSCRSCEGVLKKLKATFGIINVANKNPPFVSNAAGYSVNFDGANANALGRVYSLQLTQTW
jgi:iron complex outermembrane recepter protein